jgi:hypothetical protein
MEVIDEMTRGLVGDRLGSHVYKKRLGVDGRGKRGGGRAIVVFKAREVVLFVFGYLKSECANISSNEEEQVRLFARDFMKLSNDARLKLASAGKLLPIKER